MGSMPKHVQRTNVSTRNILEWVYITYQRLPRFVETMRTDISNGFINWTFYLINVSSNIFINNVWWRIAYGSCIEHTWLYLLIFKSKTDILLTETKFFYQTWKSNAFKYVCSLFVECILCFFHLHEGRCDRTFVDRPGNKLTLTIRACVDTTGRNSLKQNIRNFQWQNLQGFFSQKYLS